MNPNTFSSISSGGQRPCSPPGNSALSLVIVLVSGLMLGTGCSPSLAPLFRDFETDAPQAMTDARITRALETAGWEQAGSRTPNAIRTGERTLNRRLFYKTVVSLEIVPIGEEFIRVFIHPYRDNLIGPRSKIPYLQANVRRRIVGPLIDAFAEEGLYEVGSAPRDTMAADSGMANR